MMIYRCVHINNVGAGFARPDMKMNHHNKGGQTPPLRNDNYFV